MKEVTFTTENLSEVFKTCSAYVSKKANGVPATQFIRLEYTQSECTVYATDNEKVITFKTPCESEGEGTMEVPIVRLPKKSLVKITGEENEIVFSFSDGSKIIERKEGTEYPVSIKKIFGSFGEPAIKFAFNPRLLREALTGFANDAYVEIEVFGTLKPLLLKYEDKEAYVMPCDITNMV